MCECACACAKAGQAGSFGPDWKDCGRIPSAERRKETRKTFVGGAPLQLSHMGDVPSSLNDPLDQIAATADLHVRHSRLEHPSHLSLPSPPGPQDLLPFGSTGEDVLTSQYAPETSPDHVSNNPVPKAAIPLGPETPEDVRQSIQPPSVAACSRNIIERLTDKNVPAAMTMLDLPFASPSISSRLVVKQPTVTRKLRLPSFDALGIAAPHPDRIGSYSIQLFPLVGAGPLSNPDDHLHELSYRLDSRTAPVAHDAVFNAHEIDTSTPTPTLTPTPKPARPIAAFAKGTNHKKLHHFISTFTPPEENPSIDWTVVLTHVEPAGALQGGEELATMDGDRDGSPEQASDLMVDVTAAPSDAATLAEARSDEKEDEIIPSWLKGAAETIREFR